LFSIESGVLHTGHKYPGVVVPLAKEGFSRILRYIVFQNGGIVDEGVSRIILMAI
jgi:hypothetical protein